MLKVTKNWLISLINVEFFNDVGGRFAPLPFLGLMLVYFATNQHFTMSYIRNRPTSITCRPEAVNTSEKNIEQ